MTQPHRWITRKAEAEVTASLLRTPPLTKQLGDHGAKVNVDLDPPPVLTCPPHGGSTMGIERLIPATRDRVAPQLPRDRRRRATEPTGDHPQTQPGPTQIGDLDALVLRKVTGADLTDRQAIQRRDEPDHHTVAIDLVPRAQFAPEDRDTPTSRAAARILHPRARNSMNP